jgi:hypothetical protein
MDINADLSFTSGATAYRAKDVKALSLTNQASTLSASTYACTLFSTDADGELYWNDNNGRQVQLTTDGSVNVSTTGGVTGSGYGTGSVEVNWDAANTRYKMRSGAATDDYASVLLNDLQLNDGSTNTLTVAAPSLSADYTLTLPTAVAASDGSLVTMSTAGALASTMAPSVTTLTTSGAVTVGGGLRLGAVQTYSGNQTVTTADSVIIWTASAGQTLTLPASPATGQILFIRVHGGSGSRTIARNGKQINGASSDLSVGTSDCKILVYDGTGWYTILPT